MKIMYFYEKMCTDSLIISHVRKYSYESISSGTQSKCKTTFVCKKMRTDPMIILRVRKCLYESISMGKPSKYFLQKIGINARKARVHVRRSFSFVLIKAIETIYKI